jgi:DNA-binding PadR family transcriptional regulator
MSLKHSILSILCRKAKTGYELAKNSEISTRFFWSSTHQQIYKDLSQLEKLGWVRHKEIEQDEKPDKKLYSITKSGVEELRQWIAEPSEPEPSKDVLLIKLFAGDLVDPEILLKDLLGHKKIHSERSKRYKEIEAEYFKPGSELSLARQFQHLTLRRGITYEVSWLNWCREAEHFLRERIVQKAEKK